MFSLQDMPSASTIFSAYASMTGTMMLVRSMVNELVPHPVRGYLVSTFQYLFKPSSSQLTLIIEERNGMVRNQVYEASENYLCTKISPEAKCLKITKTPKEKKLTIRFEKGERFVDSFEGVVLKWRFICAESESSNDPRYSSRTEKRYFELSFNVKHREKVLESYLPFVLNKSKAMKDEEKVVKLYTLGSQHSCGGVPWESINLEHPSTFDTLAMDPKEKRSVMEDLDRFVRRKEFYKRVGRAWKRGYLLYGPPGTGKSSLIAAMANYLKFDVYDLQLANVMRDSDLRRLLLATTNRSILVIEDIDCSVELPDRQQHENANGRKFPDPQLTLSGLLNFIDGLWSSCGDERIIVFTTNHKERLDPALLRPGRMDLHIHMSYCTAYGFKLLASNYLGICGHHRLFEEIEGLLENTKVTPAQVAEELMKSEDAEIALGELVKLLKRKKDEGEDEPADEVAKKLGIRRAKRQKIGNKLEKSVKNCTRRGTRTRNL